MKIGPKTFAFVDGGVTAYNPAFLLYRMATHPAYQLGWKTDERNLLLVSLGTGIADTLDVNASANIAVNLAGLPSALMHTIQIEEDINCSTVGRCMFAAHIDRELQDLTCPGKGLLLAGVAGNGRTAAALRGSGTGVSVCPLQC